jgi:hypothetical protein
MMAVCRHYVFIIEIINNTRGGIVILIQSKKGNAAIGGNLSPGCVFMFPLVTSFKSANQSTILYIRDLNLPPISCVPNF